MDAASRSQELIARLKLLANPQNAAGMARFGINPQGTLGIPIPILRQMAKETGRDHALAEALWASGVHEARILASLVADPVQVDEVLMERWVSDFDSWDVCDQVCGNLFDRSAYAWEKAAAWSAREEEFVKRAGFALMAALASHAKKAPDSAFEPFFALILRQSCDERNFVKKAVNWALRGLGKRSPGLNRRALETARQMLELPCRAAAWNAKDALRELESAPVQAKIFRTRQ